jgi:RNA-directed DNA polymerase
MIKYNEINWNDCLFKLNKIQG